MVLVLGLGGDRRWREKQIPAGKRANYGAAVMCISDSVDDDEVSAGFADGEVIE
jgi:hypothetical protein